MTPITSRKSLWGALAALVVISSAVFASTPNGQVMFGAGNPVTLTGSAAPTANQPAVISDTAGNAAQTAGTLHSFRNNGVEKAAIDYLGNFHGNTATAPPDCAGGALSLTVAQFLGARIFTCATTQTITLPTWVGAAGIVQNLQGTPAVGDIHGPFLFVATAAFAVTPALGTGGTNGGGTLTVAANSTRAMWCRLTNVTAGAEAATCW